uniref:Uncharacterized protein n=1 Tax=uncultured Alphaproteobacteria bacterium TaxID=91750 RepID=A0A6G8F345_9PROT|nr:hypothetical protein PlAlph_5650 [uncultured Alphaproteobacteria bacterium]
MDKITFLKYTITKYEPAKVFPHYQQIPEETLKEMMNIFFIVSNNDDVNDYHIFGGKNIDGAISNLMKTKLLSKEEKQIFSDNVGKLESFSV